MRLGFRKAWLSTGLALLTLSTMLLAACGGSSGSSQAAPDSKQVLKRYLVVTKLDVRTLDPAVVTDFYSFFPIYLTMPSLLTFDDKLNAVPWAADGMPTISTDGLTYTFKIKAGLKWSDGSPIDANTFAYSINRSLSPCTASAVASYLYPIKDAAAFNGEDCSGSPNDATSTRQVQGAIPTLIGDSLVVSDPQTLVITLGSPAAFFTQALLYPTSFAQPKQLIEAPGATKANWTAHLLDGGGFGGNLYKVQLWDHAGHINLVRNDAFWGTKPKLREIDFNVYKTTDAEYADFQTGRIDIGAPTNALYAQAKTKSNFHELGSLSIGYLQPNWKKAPFDDLAARQAFAMAIDKDLVSNQVNKGTEIPTNHIVPEGQPGYNPNLNGVDGTPSLHANPTKALAAITDYAARKCGGNIKACPEVTITTSDDPDTVTSLTAILNQMTTNLGGYPVKLRTTDFNSLIDEIYGPDPGQMWYIGWIADYPDPQDWLTLQFGPGASNNTGSAHIPEADALMVKADANSNPTERLSQYNQAEQLLVTQVGWIPLAQGKGFYQTASYVQNYAISALGYPVLQTWQKAFVNNH